MCQLCHLGADANVLSLVWQHLSLQSKLLQLTLLCRCAVVSQSLLLPAAFQYDGLEMEHTLVPGQDIAESVAAVRLPPYLSAIRALVVMFTPASHVSMNTSASSPPSGTQTLQSSSSSLQRAGADGSSETPTQAVAPCRLSIGVDSLSQLRALELRGLRCDRCPSAGQGTEENDTCERSSRSFPLLPHLELLELIGTVNYHCLCWLLSIPSQCPKLAHFDCKYFKILPQSQPGVDAPPSASDSLLLLSFVRWLSTVNHNFIYPDFPLQTILLQLLREEPAEPGAVKVEHVLLSHLHDELSWDDWRASVALSPFRFLPATGPPDAIHEPVWSAIRFLDLSKLSAFVQVDADLISALPPLPSLRYVILPECTSTVDFEARCIINGVFR